MSVVLRPPAHAVRLLTLAAGVAVAEGIQAASGADAGVKWPNDVCLPPSRPRKVAGILAEANASGTQVEYVVVGIGMNVGPQRCRRASLTARRRSRRSWDGRCRAARSPRRCCAALWYRYQQLVGREDGAVLQAWRARGVATFGRTVEWESGGETMRGVARDVDPSGALVVDTPRGVTSIGSGEVRWLT